MTENDQETVGPEASSEPEAIETSPISVETDVVSPGEAGKPAAGEEQPTAAQKPAGGGDFVPKAEFDALHQQYRSLQGQFGDRNARINTLEERLKELENSGSAAPTPETPYPLLSKEEVDGWDPEVLDVQARIVQGAIDTALPRAIQPILARLDALEGSQSVMSREAFWDKVDAAYPGAKALDHEPRWDVFLQTQREPVSGLPYLVLAQKAEADRSVERLVNIFTAYAAYTGTAGPGDNVSTQIKPPQARGGNGAPVPTKPPMINESTLQQFYTDVSKGKFEGKRKEYEQKKAMFDKAIDEGRIRLGQ